MSRSADRGADSYLGFVGVTTGASSIRRVFPIWARELGLPTDRLVGYDLALDSPAAAYREVVASIKRDPQHWGALVTSHKLAVYRWARDLFDEVDDLAETFQEISSVANRGTGLTGAAKDPVTARLALEEFVPSDHFARTGAAALVLGSGGAGCALTYVLGQRRDLPSSIICTALSQEPLDHQRMLHERGGVDRDRVRYVVTRSVSDVDALIGELPPGSLVANATGMGKDRPGSPVSDTGVFCEGGLVWELNYRGSLDFLQQANRQADARGLVVEDGWRYFIHGWTQVIADVFDRPIAPETIARLSALAAGVR